ncbi:SDR family oxidoreductase [Vibrio cholerae]|nr:SDR family oxidoreductase [Vibrio cholerae]ELJ8546174.1 SDR family oxidoreductase [Vibrio cholerae]ELJ8749099.1 SDR family oxidoreductase [Vibrio cholerae]ELJ8750176.1 SDR family oxidoreductase [Vibrio cholerae]
MRGLTHKVALVTGAANGIGLAIAERLYQEGATLALADWNEEQLAIVIEQFDSARVFAQKVDVSDPEQVQALVRKTVERFGRLDILVNNAGIHIPGTVLECSVQDWRRIASVNIDGVVYCATKGAVVNFTRALALDHGAQGVRINAVCPSLVKTNMTNGWPQAIRDQFNERIALGRAAEPKEIAAVVAFLASDDASFVHGVNLPVDGGATASDGQPKIV